MLDVQGRIDDLAARSLAGADATNRDAMVTRLTEAGDLYADALSAVGSVAVEAARVAADTAFTAATAAWISSAQPAHEAADRFARYVLGTGAPIAFVSDGSAADELLTRQTQASKALEAPGHPMHALADESQAHANAVGSAYNARPIEPHYGPPLTTPTAVFGVPPSSGVPRVSIRSYEVNVLGPLLAEADLLIAELDFT